MRARCRRKFLAVGLVIDARSRFLFSAEHFSFFFFGNNIFSYSTQLELRFFLEALIFVVLVADFAVSPGQIDYDAPVAGVFFTTTIQNILKFAAVAVTIAIDVVGLSTIVIIIVTAAAAAATNRVSKVSNQRQLR